MPTNPSVFRRLSLPALSYGLDRPFRWPWLSYVAALFVLLVLGMLIPLNYALQGYQVITTYERDPNTTTYQWFTYFTGAEEPGSRCDDHLFDVGDTFRTSAGLFSYSIQSTAYNSDDSKIRATFGATTIPYKGLSLDWCDVTSLGVQVGPVQATATLSATIECFNIDFRVNATTTYFVSGAFETADYLALPEDSPFYYLQYAAVDMFSQNVSSTLLPTPHRIGDIPITFLIPAPLYIYCPMAVFNNETVANVLLADNFMSDPNAFCSEENYTNATPLYIFDDVFSPVIFDTNSTTAHALGNILQVMLALVRFDLGSHLPNNFLFNTSAVMADNQTFLSVGNSGLMAAVGQDLQDHVLPYGPGSTYYSQLNTTPIIQTTYTCRLTVPKSTGAAVVSVVVATLTIGSTIWGLFILTATCFAKRTPGSNYCEYHSLEAGAAIPLPVQADDSDIEMREPLRPAYAASNSRRGPPLLDVDVDIRSN